MTEAILGPLYHNLVKIQYGQQRISLKLRDGSSVPVVEQCSPPVTSNSCHFVTSGRFVMFVRLVNTLVSSSSTPSSNFCHFLPCLHFFFMDTLAFNYH
eukprot:g57636.t1